MSRIKLSLGMLAVLLLLGAALTPLAAADSPLAATAVAPSSADVMAQDEASLPEGLANIFAVLGVYVVTMFTMAIGTEVVVDILKVAIGLKSKPDALKTLEEYEKLLPGRMEDLGLSAQAQANLQNQLTALKGILTPAFKAETVIAHLQQERFTEALHAAVGDEAVDDLIERAKVITKAQIHTAVSHIDPHSLLGLALTSSVLAQLDALVDEAAAGASEITPEDLFRVSSSLVNGRLAEATTTWTQQKLTELRHVSYETAQSLYEMQIKPQIENSGLNTETQERIDLQFQNFLENLKISQKADIYLKSANQLLLEVERRRDEATGLFDRWWTRLRYWLRGQLSRVFTTMQPNPQHKKRNITIEHPMEAATKLLEIKERDKQEAAFRVQQLRLLSVILGILLAWALQIDSADILKGLFPTDANFLYITIIPADFRPFLWLRQVVGIMPKELTAGIILTGLAASAGSSFWHDQLQHLESTRKSAEAVNAALQPIININPPSNGGKHDV